MKKYNTEYKVVRWQNPDELAATLTEHAVGNWQEHLTRLSAGESGWTILKRTTEIKPMLIGIDIPVSEIYSVINRTDFLQSEGQKHLGWPYKTIHGEMIDKKIKEYYQMIYGDLE